VWEIACPAWDGLVVLSAPYCVSAAEKGCLAFVPALMRRNVSLSKQSNIGPWNSKSFSHSGGRLRSGERREPTTLTTAHFVQSTGASVSGVQSHPSQRLIAYLCGDHEPGTVMKLTSAFLVSGRHHCGTIWQINGTGSGYGRFLSALAASPRVRRTRLIYRGRENFSGRWLERDRCPNCLDRSQMRLGRDSGFLVSRQTARFRWRLYVLQASPLRRLLSLRNSQIAKQSQPGGANESAGRYVIPCHPRRILPNILAPFR